MPGYEQRNIVELIQSGQYDAALTVLHSALAVDPDNWHLFYLAGLALRGAQDFRASIGAYHESLRLLPDGMARSERPQIGLGLGVAYQQNGDFPEAIQCFVVAIREDPAMLNAYNSLGYTYRTM